MTNRVPTTSASPKRGRPGPEANNPRPPRVFRDATIFLHMDATFDISKLAIVKALFPTTAGKYAARED